MLEVSYKTLRSPEFFKAMQKISAHPFKDIKSSYRIAQLCGHLDAETTKCNDLFLKLVTKYGTVDDKTKKYSIPDEMVPAWEKEVLEFQAHTVSLPADKLLLDELTGVALTPIELMFAEPIIEGTVH